MRFPLSALALVFSAQAALADQFIATFMSPDHPRNLRIGITQLNSSGSTIDQVNERIARVGPTQSTWAVLLEPGAARVCVTMRGNERATSATAMLSGGRQETVQIANGGQQICPAANPADIEIVIINF